MDEDLLLHFTSAHALASILRTGILRPGPKPYGIYPIPHELSAHHQSVCFTEERIENAQRIASRRGLWGIAIPRNVVEKAGGRAVTYLNATETIEIRARLKAARGDHSDPIWLRTPFLSPLASDYDWHHEREWRLNKELHFDWSYVHAIINPLGRTSALVPDEDLGEIEIYTSHDGETEFDWIDGSSEPFNLVMRQALKDFGNEFVNPDHVLPYDKEDETGFAWMGLTQYDAYEVIQAAIPAAPWPIIDELAEHLQRQAMYWVSADELSKFHL